MREIKNSDLNDLCKVLEKRTGEELTIITKEAISVDNTIELIRYPTSNIIYIINNNQLVFSLHDPIDLDPFLSDWLIKHNYNENLVAYTGSISVGKIQFFPNLYSANIVLGGERPAVVLDKLRSLSVEQYESIEQLSFASPANLLSLEVTSFTADIDVSEFNQFKALTELRIIIGNAYKLLLGSVYLPNMTHITIYGHSFTLGDFSASTKLKHVAGNIDTNIDFSHLDIQPVTLITQMMDCVNLDNINSTKLQTFISDDVAIDISTSIPSLINWNTYYTGNKKVEYRNLKLSSLKLLPNLQTIMFRFKNLVNDCEENWRHSKLKIIRASDCTTPEDKLEFVKHFPKVEYLGFSNSNIEDLSPLTHLEKLSNADLTRNKIVDIPPELAEKFQLLTTPHEGSDGLYVLRNPLISPPEEIISRGTEAIDSYFGSMVGETEELNEAKIVFLGNGEVGKTSLMKTLSGEKFDPNEKTTHGINICKYRVPINEQRHIDAAIWDFGGQQIMHATHQLFLSQRCVYILVINDRKEDLQQDQKIEYWLQQIRTFGGDSKVIILRNKVDMFDLNNLQEGRLKEKFPNLLAIEGVSCKSGTGVERARNLINEQVRKLPMRKVKLAKNWIAVKEEIKSLSYQKDHLPLSAFKEICTKHGVNDLRAQQTLRTLLHDLSVIIAFPQLVALDMGILNPHWITDGIYTIINSKTLAVNKGYIKLTEAQEELDTVHPGKYSEKADFIIRSMIQFELCHSVGSEVSNTYLVPNLLPTETKSKKIISGTNTIQLLFKYENLLPPALFPKLLVRLSKHIAADKRWRTGAVLTDAELKVQARIEEDSVDRSIHVTVSGEQARDFFAVIRHAIRDLNGVNTEQLGVQELIPIPDSDQAVSYDELIGHERNKRKKYFSGKLGREFDVAHLLSGIESREETAKAVDTELEGFILNVNVDASNVVNNTNNNTNTQDQTATQSQQIEIRTELKDLRGTGDYVLDDLKSDADYDIEDERERTRFIRECDRVQAAIENIEQVENEEEAHCSSRHFSRVRDFLNSALDNKGAVGDALQSMTENVGKVRELAKKYNTVASYFGFPVVPEVLL